VSGSPLVVGVGVLTERVRGGPLVIGVFTEQVNGDGSLLLAEDFVAVLKVVGVLTERVSGGPLVGIDKGGHDAGPVHCAGGRRVP
jgi:hypothetical protein